MYNNCVEIQTALVELEDKEKSIIGSSQWIGAFEVNLCVQNFMGVSKNHWITALFIVYIGRLPDNEPELRC